MTRKRSHGVLRNPRSYVPRTALHGAVRQLVKDGLPVDILIDPAISKRLVSADAVNVFPEIGAARLGSITREEATKAVRNGLAVRILYDCEEAASVRLTAKAEFIPLVGNSRVDINAISAGLFSPR